jgi:hypothetical protein
MICARLTLTIRKHFFVLMIIKRRNSIEGKVHVILEIPQNLEIFVQFRNPRTFNSSIWTRFQEFWKLTEPRSVDTTIRIFTINVLHTAPYTDLFSRNLGHCTTAPYPRPHFHSIRLYTCRNLIMIGPYFCARYYGRIVRPGNSISVE